MKIAFMLNKIYINFTLLCSPNSHLLAAPAVLLLLGVVERYEGCAYAA
jgi:hypothetical protein